MLIIKSLVQHPKLGKHQCIKPGIKPFDSFLLHGFAGNVISDKDIANGMVLIEEQVFTDTIDQPDLGLSKDLVSLAFFLSLGYYSSTNDCWIATGRWKIPIVGGSTITIDECIDSHRGIYTYISDNKIENLEFLKLKESSIVRFGSGIPIEFSEYKEPTHHRWYPYK